MIKINLCPIDELESPYWYVPDLVVVAVVGLIGFFAASYYLGSIQAEIDVAKEEIASLEQSIKDLEPDIAKFKGLGAEISELEGKLTALKDITVSKIARYRPVIILEHLQNLKPDGVWYTSMKIGSSQTSAEGTSSDEFEITGQSFDNILTAELLTAIRSTATQEADESDLRTMVYFGFLVLDDSHIDNVVIPTDGTPVAGANMARFPRFSMRGRFIERATAPANAPPAPGAKPPPPDGGPPMATGPEAPDAQPQKVF